MERLDEVEHEVREVKSSLKSLNTKVGALIVILIGSSASNHISIENAGTLLGWLF